MAKRYQKGNQKRKSKKDRQYKEKKIPYALPFTMAALCGKLLFCVPIDTHE
jgi:hypothetical protein